MDLSRLAPRHATWLTRTELIQHARAMSLRTRSGNFLYHTNIKSRSATKTQVVYTPDAEIATKLASIAEYLDTHECITVDRVIGTTSPFRFSVRLIVEAKHPQIALMFSENFFPPQETFATPAITVIDIPSWPETEIIVFPHLKTTIVLGSNYYGEAKMASLRMAMHIAREERGALGLHAGSKVFHLVENGTPTSKGILVFGLSGTGKTTIICEDHGLVAPESVEIFQDDIVMLTEKAAAFGTERNFYVKTDNINRQPLLLDAVYATEAIWENVYVDAMGEVDFDNYSISTNGRAIIPRDKIRLRAPSIDLDKVHYVFFNTRRYDIPPVGRLVSPAQAAAFYMLGESIITSADDPTRVGETKRVVGFDPFIIDAPEKNGNRLFEILGANPDIQCFVLNTGKVGGIQQGVKITPQDTFKIVETIVRGGVSWQFDPVLGYDVPTDIPGVHLAGFDQNVLYGADSFRTMMDALRDERLKYLHTFRGLNPAIADSP